MVDVDLRWLAPVPIDFACVVGAADRDGEAYATFWESARAKVNDPSVTFHHAQLDVEGLEYARAAGDELPRSLEVVSGSADPGELGVDLDGVTCRDLSWSIFDHGVALVEGTVRLSIGARGPDAAYEAEERLQALGDVLARACVAGPMTDVIETVAAVPGAERQVVVAGRGHGRPLWVARALLLDVRDPRAVEFARGWLTGVDSEADALVDAMVQGPRTNVTRWLNYVYRSDIDTSVQWNALRRAQYFYAGLRGVDRGLTEILAWSMTDDRRVSLSGLRTELEGAMSRAQALLLLKAEVSTYASRISRAEFEAILRCWDYREVLDEPVRQKLDLCRQRIDALAADRAARSSVFTDVILMTIGVTSILSTALALVAFGRDSAEDASQSSFDLGAGSITTWFASQPIDAVVVISSVVSLVLVLTFVILRRRSIS